MLLIRENLYMIERITIYGDSFAHPGRKEDCHHPTWYGLLEEEGYEVTNLGESGSGPMYSFKHMYKNAHTYNEQDLVVFIISGSPRVCFTGNHQIDTRIKLFADNDPYYDQVVKQDKLRDVQEKLFNNYMGKYGKGVKLALEIFGDELIYSNWKYESFLYALSRNHCKVFAYFLTLDESYFKSSLNDTRYHCYCESLEEVSWNEYIKEERQRDQGDDQYYRINHLSAENHIIMYQQIVNFMKGLYIPNFLQGIYKGTYNDKEFVYD